MKNTTRDIRSGKAWLESSDVDSALRLVATPRSWPEFVPERINENNLVLSGLHPEKSHSCIHALGMREWNKLDTTLKGNFKVVATRYGTILSDTQASMPVNTSSHPALLMKKLIFIPSSCLKGLPRILRGDLNRTR
jgi:hypothetical protein